MSTAVCAACQRPIDAAAKLCPYCGANPSTGEKLDTQALLQEVFRPKEMTRSQTLMEYARQRQGVVVAISAALAFLVLAGMHQFIRMRNETTSADSTAVPLTEVADLANKVDESRPVPMPDLDFQYGGNPKAMRTYIVENGAAAPAPPATATTTATTTTTPAPPTPRPTQ